MTFEEIRDFLTEKFTKEKKRLRTYGTKASPFDLANAVTRYVESLMTLSRYKELQRLQKVLDKQPSQGDVGKIWKHCKERTKATKAMATAIFNVAVKTESQRPRKHDAKLNKEYQASLKKHWTGKDKEKHGHKRSSRSSKHRSKKRK